MNSATVGRPRGSPRVHDIKREKHYLTITLEGSWRCNFSNCTTIVKHLNNARQHVRKHLRAQPPNIVSDNEEENGWFELVQIFTPCELTISANTVTLSDVAVQWDMDEGGSRSKNHYFRMFPIFSVFISEIRIL